MDATALTPESPLPDDVPTLQALVRQLLLELARLRAENEALRGKLEAARKQRLGRRSERRTSLPRATTDPPGPARPHGRAALPEHLERREVVHDLTDAEKLCPCCGQARVCSGEQTAEQLDLEPARLFVLRTRKKSYACPHCDPASVPAEQRLQTAGPAEVGPLAKGLCGPGLLAHVLTAKFAVHVPLHRLAGQLSRSGVTLTDSTLGDWVAQAADLLQPLYDLRHQRLKLARVLHGDDTTVKLRVVGADRTSKAHLGVCLGDADYPYVVFDFTTDDTAAGPERFLQGYQGYLQADALAQYEGLYGPQKIQHCCCWAHARRKFVAVVEGGDPSVQPAVAWISQLHAIERALPPLLLPSDDSVQQQRRQREEQRRQQRQQQARPILTELQRWLDRERPRALPKTPLGQALGYAVNQWAALERYLEQGYLAIDNNLSERTVRASAVGRHHWGVIGSAAADDRAAVLYSLVGTCQHLALDPIGYLGAVLPGLFALGEKPTSEQLQEWLPDRWLRTPPPDPARDVAATG
jgi:transposase